MVPVIIIVIFLTIKMKRLKNAYNVDFSLVNSLLFIKNFLIIFIVLIVFTSNKWGPPFYKIKISFSLNNQERKIEQKLEKKYNRNFVFVSKDKVNVDPKAGNYIGQDITYDYSIIYRFKDDDGVVAIVDYKKNYGTDYYESKRAQYEIKKSIKEQCHFLNLVKLSMVLKVMIMKLLMR